MTAQRREERLQDVPIAITAISGDGLETAGIQSTKDLTQVAPSLNFTQSSFSPQPTIRGIGTRGVSAGDESIVPVYIDGVYQPFLGSIAIDFNNVERVEVLKGPQSALLGRNSTGGAINIITFEPNATPRFKASASYGSFGEVVLKTFANGGNDFFAANFAVLYSDDNGYLTDLNGGPKRGDSHSFAIRPKFRFNLSDAVSLTLAANHVEHRDTLATSSQPIDGNTSARSQPGVILPTGPYQQSGTGGGLDLTQNSFSATLNADLGFASLTSVTAHDNAKQFIDADVDATNIVLVSLPVDYFSRSLYQELYLSSADSGPLDWILGGTFFSQEAGNYRSQVLVRGNPSSDVSSLIDTSSVAFYAQGTYALTEQLSLTLGGRYTSELKKFDITNNINGATTGGRKRWSVFTPSGTLQYRFSPDANVYVKAGKGFKTGIFPSTTFTDTPVDPEYVWQYELGTKFTAFDWLRGSFAAFYTDYSNLQVNIRVNNLSSLQNAGSAEIYGLEGDLAGSPVQGLNLRVGFSKLWGTFKDFQNAVGYAPTGNGGNTTYTFDASGKKIIRTPFFTLTAGADYRHELANGSAVTVAANLFHAGKSYRDADNRIVEKARTVLNGELGYQVADTGVTLTLWGRNLLDEAYTVYVLAGPTADSGIYAKPRTWGGRVSYEF